MYPELDHLASLVVKKIKELKGDKRLDISNIRNGENLAIAASRPKLDMNDMRWHGAGDTVEAGTNITISTVDGKKRISATTGVVPASSVTAGTFGTGNYVFNTNTTTGTAVTINANSLTTGNGLVINGSNTSGGQSGYLVNLTGNIKASGGINPNALLNSVANIKTTGLFDIAINVNLTTNVQNTGNLGTFWSLLTNINDATNLANFVYGLDFAVNLTGNAAKTAYGATGNVTSTSTVADTIYAGIFGSIESGAVTSGTQTVVGVQGTATSINGNGATVLVYGGYFQADGTVTSGIINAYGVYVANGTSSTSGTSSKYGVYVEAITGADTNYAIYTLGGIIYHANTGAAGVVILNRTDGKILSIGAGGISSTFAFDESGIYKIESNSRANIVAGVFGTGATTRLQIDGTTGAVTITNNLILSSIVRLKAYTVATLPAGTQGDTAFVTDATAPTYLGALVGGGTVVAPVFYNGTAWVSS